MRKRVKFTVNFEGCERYVGLEEAETLSQAEFRLKRASTRVPFTKTTTPEGEREFDEYCAVIIESWTSSDATFAEEAASDPECYLEDYPEYFIDGDVGRLSDEAPEFLGARDGGETTINVCGRAEVAFIVDYDKYIGIGGSFDSLDADEVDEIDEIEMREAYKRAVKKIRAAIPFFPDIEDFLTVVERAEIVERHRQQ